MAVGDSRGRNIGLGDGLFFGSLDILGVRIFNVTVLNRVFRVAVRLFCEGRILRHGCMAFPAGKFTLRALGQAPSAVSSGAACLPYISIMESMAISAIKKVKLVCR